ncbi:MAG: VTT domain-containing protein [Nitrosopumilus sp.]|nr:VTT domain-containing protein [Nitrosopumilus sp.]
MSVFLLISADIFSYINILIVSFITSIILFIPIPYVPVLIASSFNEKLDPNLIALTSTVGVTAGRTIIFLASYYGRKILKDRTKEKMIPLQRLLMRYGWIGAFISAITPFPPDDMIIILLGIAKYNPLKFVVANFAGKLIANMAVVWGAILMGKPLIEQIFAQSQSPLSIIVISVVSVTSMVLIIYSLIKVDWAKIIGKWFPWTLNDDPKDNK